MQRFWLLLAMFVSFICFGLAPAAEAKVLGHNGRTLAIVTAWIKDNPDVKTQHIPLNTKITINGRDFVLDGKPLHTVWGAASAFDKEFPTAQAPQAAAPAATTIQPTAVTPASQPAPAAAPAVKTFAPAAANAASNSTPKNLPQLNATAAYTFDWRTAILAAAIIVAGITAFLAWKLLSTLNRISAQRAQKPFTRPAVEPVAEPEIEPIAESVAPAAPTPVMEEDLPPQDIAVAEPEPAAANESQPLEKGSQSEYRERSAAEAEAILATARSKRNFAPKPMSSPYPDDLGRLTAASVVK